jgi:glutamate transport system substrate-binding protein
MRLRHASTVAVGALLVASLAACSSGTKKAGDTAKTQFPAGSTMEKIQKRGKLIVGTDDATPLFSIKNPTTGKMEGFDADIARLIAKEITGSENNVEFIQTTAENREPFIETGKVDVVVETYSITDERKRVVSFAGPYYVAGQDMLVAKSDTSIKSVEDLNGKTVCAITGTTTERNVKDAAPNAKVVNFEGANTCIEGVKDGRFPVYVDDDVTLIGNVEQNPDQLKMVGAPFTKEPYGIGLKKDDDTFRSFLNDLLEKHIKNGTWEKLFQDNIGKISGTKPVVPTIER